MTTSDAEPTRQPAVFFGHGSPMNALERNRYTAAWRTFGESAPRPAAILAISAHWYINAQAVTAMSQPRTIHDFYGFPDELFAVEYPAPGDPDLADKIADTVRPTRVGKDVDSWGIDHGTWSVLVHAFPDADIPVVQLSINATKPFEDHLELGARLAPLRDQGVMIVGSGNAVHNLRALDWARPDLAFDWTRRFDDEVARIMTSSPSELPGIAAHPDYALAHPTAEHFIPLLYVAGLAAAADEAAGVLVDGYAMGSLSMSSFTVGCGVLHSDGEGAAASLPPISAADTNM